MSLFDALSDLLDNSKNMAHIADNDLAAASCDDCGNIYVVRLCPDEGSEPIGVPSGCGSCGGETFSVLQRDSPDSSGSVVGG